MATIDNTDVLFGFSNTSVSVVEGEGVVSVDIGIRGGAVSEPFQVQVFTSDGSAEGMWLINHNICSIVLAKG